VIAVDYLPDTLREAGVRGARALDVRLLLARGDEPFDVIIQTVTALADDEALHLIAPFEPRPLYDVMRGRGRVAHTEREGDTFHVWFYRRESSPRR
jgi:uncharacterized protein (DUF2249 family)